MKTDEGYMTPDEVAEFLSVSRQTVYTLLDAGELDSIKMERMRRISRASLAAYLERRAVPPKGSEP